MMALSGLKRRAIEDCGSWPNSLLAAAGQKLFSHTSRENRHAVWSAIINSAVCGHLRMQSCPVAVASKSGALTARCRPSNIARARLFKRCEVFGICHVPLRLMQDTLIERGTTQCGVGSEESWISVRARLQRQVCGE